MDQCIRELILLVKGYLASRSRGRRSMKLHPLFSHSTRAALQEKAT